MERAAGRVGVHSLLNELRELNLVSRHCKGGREMGAADWISKETDKGVWAGRKAKDTYVIRR